MSSTRKFHPDGTRRSLGVAARRGGEMAGSPESDRTTTHGSDPQTLHRSGRDVRARDGGDVRFGVTDVEVRADILIGADGRHS